VVELSLIGEKKGIFLNERISTRKPGKINKRQKQEGRKNPPFLKPKDSRTVGKFLKKTQTGNKILKEEKGATR